METKRIILLVEDNANDVELTKRALRKNSVSNEIVVAQDGVVALDYLFARGKFVGRNSNTDPELILLDLNMPRMDGIETLQNIRSDERTKLIPVVILTSSEEEKDRVETYKLGANSYIRKPVDFVQFSEAVKQLSLYWLVINTPPPERRRG